MTQETGPMRLLHAAHHGGEMQAIQLRGAS